MKLRSFFIFTERRHKQRVNIPRHSIQYILKNNFMKTGENISSLESTEQLKTELDKIRKIVSENSSRIAELGEWPEYIEPGSLSERIPDESGKMFAGFDAGVASAMDLIPRDKQKLSAKLHAHYTKESIRQIQDEILKDDPDSETAWWLSACFICKEGQTDGPTFLRQLADFKKLRDDSEKRRESTNKEREAISRSFYLKDGVPFGTEDGCIQGAYIAGYPFGTQYDENSGLFFIGTYEESLGLEDFDWSKETDEEGNRKSGPVFGSKQFVKCASETEWRRAVEIVKKKLQISSRSDFGKKLGLF